MNAGTQDRQFKRSYGMPHPPNIYGRYKGYAIVIDIISCFGPKFFKIKALYVEDDPILIDPYPLFMSYALDSFGRLLEIGEIAEFDHLGLSKDVPPKFRFPNCKQLIDNPFPEEWVILQNRKKGNSGRKGKRKGTYKSAEYITISDDDDDDDGDDEMEDREKSS
ncbi:MAG: hypothetical protein M1839_008486 [Geoglossum umbratile]|nr:MAG: hypothetical protein M1839_008486 [Geoglossum umbratile]